MVKKNNTTVLFDKELNNITLALFYPFFPYRTKLNLYLIGSTCTENRQYGTAKCKFRADGT